MWPDWPGHSRDHLAMKVAIQPRRCASILVKVLNSAARSAPPSASEYWMRGLEHAGAGLGVQAFERHAHHLAHLEQARVELGMHRAAQHRIAEEAGRHRLQVAIALLAHRMRRLLEDEELVFEPPPRPRSPCLARARARGAAVPRGQIASALPSNSPRKNSMSPSSGSARQVDGHDAARSHPDRRCASR